MADPTPALERILMIVAHPDDIDFSSAGSIATWTGAGIEVTYCLVTSGDAGSDDLTLSTADLVATREAEQRAAGAVVGVSDVRFLRQSDGHVEATPELRRDLSRVIRDVRPHRVVTHNPEYNLEAIYASHPDHLAVGRAALAAVYPDARNPRAFPELLDEGHQPWAVPEVWIMAGRTVPADVAHVDITDVIDRKIDALRAHVSQTSSRDLDPMIRAWAASNAETVGLPVGRYAELFRHVDTR